MAVIDKRVQASVSADPTQWIADFDKMVGSVDKLESSMTDLSAKIDKLAAKDATIAIKADTEQFTTETDKVSEEVDKLKTADATVNVKAMTDNAIKNMLLVQEKLDLLGKQQALPSVDLKGFAETEVKIRAISAQIDALNKKSSGSGGYGLINPPGGGGGSGAASAAGSAAGDSSGVMGLVTANPIAGIAALAPAASPLIAGLSGAVLGLASAMGIAAVAAVPLGLELKSTFTDVSAAETAFTTYQGNVKEYGADSTQAKTAQIAYNAAIARMGPSATSALQGLQDMKTELTNLKTVSEQFTVPILDKAFSVVDLALPMAVPLIKSASGAVQGLLDEIKGDLGSSGFEQFIQYIAKEGGPAITAFGQSAINIFAFIGKGMEALTPLTHFMEQGLENMTASWDKWAGGLGTDSEFNKFVAFAEESLPKVVDLFMSLLKFIGTFTMSFSSSGMVILETVTGLVNILSKLSEVVGPPLGIVLNLIQEVGDALNIITDGHATAAILAIGAAWFIYSNASGIAAVATMGLSVALKSMAASEDAGIFTKMAASISTEFNPGVALAIIGVGALVWGIHALATEDAAAQKAADALLASMDKIDTSKFSSVDSLNNGVAAQMQQLQQLADMKGNVNNAGQGAQQWVPSGSQITSMAALQNAANQAGVSLNTYIDAVEGAKKAEQDLDAQNTVVQSNLSILAQTYGISQDAVLRLANANGIDLSKSFDSIVGKMGGAVTAAEDANNAQKVLADQVQSLGDITTTTSQKVQNLTDILNTLTGNNVSYITATTNFQKAITDLGTALDPTSRSLSEFSAGGQTNLLALGNVVTSMNTSVTGLYQHLLDTESPTKALADATLAWKDSVNELNGQLLKVGFTPAQVKTIDDLFNLNPAGLADSIAKAGPAVAAAAAATGGAGGAALNTALGKAATVTPDEVAKWTAAIKASEGLFTTAGNESGTNYGIGVGHGITGEKKDAQGASEGIANSLSGLALFGSSGVTVGGKYGIGIGDGISAKENAAIIAAQNVVNVLNAEAGSAYSSGQYIGGNFGQGIVVGIGENVRAVAAAAAGLMTAAHVSTNNLIRSQSPSRLLADTTGKWFAQGIAVGITETTGEVTNSAIALMQATVDAANKAIKAQSPAQLLADTTGTWFAQGVAQGILANIDLVSAAATTMMTDAAAAATALAPTLAAKVGAAVNLTGLTSVTPASLAATQDAANPTPQGLQTQIDAANKQATALQNQALDIYSSGQKNLATIQTQVDSASKSVQLLTYYLAVANGATDAKTKAEVPTITKELADATTKLTDLQNQYSTAEAFTNQDLSDQNNLIATQTQLVGSLTTQLNQMVYAQGETSASNLATALQTQLQAIQTSSDNLKSTFSSGVLSASSLSSIITAATTASQAAATAANTASGASSAPTSITEGISAARSPVAALVTPTAVDTVQAIIDGLTTQLSQDTTFANTITDLSAKGLNADYVNQIVSMGQASGQSIATALDQASASQLNQINSLYNNVTTVANEGMGTVSKNLYSNGADAIAALIQGVIQGYPELQSVIGTVNAMLADIGSPSQLIASANNGIFSASNNGNVSNNNTVNNNVTTNESVNPSNLVAELAWMTKVSG